MAGRLSIVATPIGNLDDLSPRAARALAEADVIACEDTRVTRTLVGRAGGSKAKLVAYHARNEAQRAPELVRRIAAGAHVALATDAGMPGVSDPGQRLVAACADAGLPIEVIPGPSAVPSALIVSGLPTARFVFDGFLPRTRGARVRALEALVGEERTLVFFEAPHRIAASLADMAAVFGARRAAIARELTKMHEEVIRGLLPELAARVSEQPLRGEITVVVEGAAHLRRATMSTDPASIAADVERRVATGEHRREAIAAVAAESGLPKKVVYQAVVDHR